MPVVFHMDASESRDIPCSDSLFDRLLFRGLRTTRKRYRVSQAVLRFLLQNYAPLRDRKASYVFPGYMVDMAALEAALQKYPSVSFVAHGPLFWKHIAADGIVTSRAIPHWTTPRRRSHLASLERVLQSLR